MKYVLLFIISTTLAFLAFDFKPKKKISEEVFTPPPKHMEHYSFGYTDLFSSLMWVRVLQDIEICDQNKERILPPEIKPGKDRLEQVLHRDLPPSKCNQGWVYQMLDSITDLTPDFYLAYAAGSNFLSVLVDDREGAHHLFQKGLHYYPEDWQLLYAAAYHERNELQNPEAAAVLLKRAGERGAPAWVFALCAKLYSEVGRAQLAKTILEAVLKRKPDAEGMDRVKRRLKEINEILEKNAQ